MTQADRVHSTPPTNTSATNPPGPVDPSRRRLLTVAAGGAVAAAVAGARPTDAAPAADPIYAAIERHKELTVRFDAAWDARGRFNDCGDCDEKPSDELRRLNDAIDKAGLPMEQAACELFDTVPTTLAGVVAAIRVIQTHYGNDGEHMPHGRWLYEDEDDSKNGRDWLECFLDTLIESVDALGKAVA